MLPAACGGSTIMMQWFPPPKMVNMHTISRNKEHTEDGYQPVLLCELQKTNHMTYYEPIPFLKGLEESIWFSFHWHNEAKENHESILWITSL